MLDAVSHGRRKSERQNKLPQSKGSCVFGAAGRVTLTVSSVPDTRNTRYPTPQYPSASYNVA